MPIGALVLAGCGDTTKPPAPRPAAVSVTPSQAELPALGQTVQLIAEVRDQNGQVMTGVTIAWSSSRALVASVDASGLVTAASNGAATITATAGEAYGSASVTVDQVVSEVVVSSARDAVVERDTVRFTAAAVDANAHEVAEAAFEWASQDTLVATVDETGLVTGGAAGTVVVMATSSGVTGGADLTVVPPVPTSVRIAPDTVAFTALGQTAELSAEVFDQVGRPMAGETVSWASGDTAVAVVDSLGLVAAVAEGETAITANSGVAIAAAVVKVMQSAASVIVTPAADTVALGDTVRLVAVAADANGHELAGAAFEWSSDDPSVAQVDGSGLVTGVEEGTATITAAAGEASAAAEITIENPDRAALVAVYEATDGPNWVNSENWLTDAPLGDWYGVDMDGDGRVTSLGLYSNSLSGAIPPELGDLSKLKSLDLFNNDLIGPIPPELGDLASLTGLDLNSNALAGEIPAALGNLTSFIGLDLGFNDLTGPIPRELGDLTALESLYLPGNNLTGAIPPELGNPAKLVQLSISGNDLTGRIPPELGNLASLTGLDLGRNALTGEIPVELGSLTSLNSLHLGSNDLTGPIPRELGNLTALESLHLAGNSLTGAIPPELGNLARLGQLRLTGNDLTGAIPPELGNLHELRWLFLDSNGLTGPIPPELGNLTARGG